MEPIKKCRICGDKASGFNYNGLSCESCKVFFHRNSNHIEKLKCRNEGHCVVNISTRRCCAACRMHLCLENRMTKQLKNSVDSSSNSSSPCNSEESDPELRSNIDTLLERDIIKKMRQFDSMTILDSPVPCKERHQQKKRRQALALSLFEQEEIAKVQKAFLMLGNENSVSVIREAKTIQECMYSPDIYFRKTIEFCKNFAAFNELSPHDQLLILKPFCFNFMSVKFAYDFDAQSKTVLMYADNSGKEALIVSSDLGRNLVKQKDLVDYNMKLAMQLKATLENDDVIRDLFSAQLLFKSNVKIPFSDTFRYYFYFYSKLLQRYLEHKYGNIHQADKKYSQVQTNLRTLDLIQENKLKMMDDLEVKLELPEIIQEMYNLL